MKTRRKKRTNPIEKAQRSARRKSMIIRVMVLSILSFIAALLIAVIA